MPEPTTNPYRPDRAVIGGMERHRAWDQGYSAAQADQAAWLASDEAVERVRRVLGRYSARQDERYRDLPTWSKHDREARAVLAALRGEGDA